MKLVPYQPSDCAEILRLFYDTVHRVNAAHYTSRQLDVWATGEEDPSFWNASLLSHYTLTAKEGTFLLGFGDITAEGYLDRLYVHADAQGRGIGTALCTALEQAVPGKRLTTYASETARPFFLSRGWQCGAKHWVCRKGVFLHNWEMEKPGDQTTAKREPK